MILALGKFPAAETILYKVIQSYWSAAKTSFSRLQQTTVSMSCNVTLPRKTHMFWFWKSRIQRNIPVFNALFQLDEIEICTFSSIQYTKAIWN